MKRKAASSGAVFSNQHRKVLFHGILPEDSFDAGTRKPDHCRMQKQCKSNNPMKPDLISKEK